MQPKQDIKENIKEDIAKAQDTGTRKQRSGALIATIVFLVAYGIFVISYGHWGLALGWLPSTVVAAAFGWFGYCFPWIGEAIVLLLELIAICLG